MPGTLSTERDATEFDLTERERTECDLPVPERDATERDLTLGGWKLSGGSSGNPLPFPSSSITANTPPAPTPCPALTAAISSTSVLRLAPTPVLRTHSPSSCALFVWLLGPGLAPVSLHTRAR